MPVSYTHLNALDKMPERLRSFQEQLENLYNQQAAAKAEVGKPFPQEMCIRDSRDAQNFHITDDALGVGGAKAKFRANMAAIHLLQELEFEGLQASPCLLYTSRCV